ncbi:MAG TPA: hypothetical protein DCW29_16230, partial [Janthinobacterium sp.]|nr:hypothetical protein [Janthinobacterium sp.]
MAIDTGFPLPRQAHYRLAELKQAHTTKHGETHMKMTIERKRGLGIGAVFFSIFGALWLTGASE